MIAGVERRVLILGGGAAGACCAARLRRLDEAARIVVFDSGVADPEGCATRFNIEVRGENEVTAIDRAARRIEVREPATGRRYWEAYDALVLSPRAAPVRPAWPGADLAGIFCAGPGSPQAQEWIDTRNPRRAVVVGGGFLGLAMTEELARRGLAVTIVEKLPQLLPRLDPEMVEPLQRHLETNRVDLRLGEGAAGFSQAPGGAIAVHTEDGARLPADLVILALGVRPDTDLARQAGLEIGALGGIRTDESMRTSDPHIWAAGDAVETWDAVLGQWRLPPPAGPASRQGRVAADAICGRPAAFRGLHPTAVSSCLGFTVAIAGASEKALRAAGQSGFLSVYLHPPSRPAGAPGSHPIHMKLIFRAPDGLILGAQAAGQDGADKCVDVISMAIQRRSTVFDLEQAELCCAPPFAAARDPVNLAGMVAANVLGGDLPLAPWDEIESTGALVVDVRDPHEFAAGHIEGAINLPFSQLRARLGELPRDRPLWLYCGIGQRSYFATRLLLQRGYDARSLPGGYRTFWSLNP